MKRAALALILLFAFGATGAQADRWVSSKRLPKPIDSPIVRKKLREDHKPGKKQRHPPDPVASLSVLDLAIARA
jgi:hypothetical protein